MQLVFSWIGEADLKNFEQNLPAGPVEGFLTSTSSKQQTCFLLYSYSDKRVLPFLEQLEAKLPNIEIQPVKVTLTNPASYAEIYPLIQKLLTQVKQQPEYSLLQHNYLISSGTPAMQTIWVLMAKTQFPAVCWSGYQGVYSVVELPFKIELEYLQQAQKIADERLDSAFANKALPKSFNQIIGESPLIKQEIQKAYRFSQHQVPVLILGPTGSGKEVFARSIHQASPQNSGKFVAVNCGALPHELAESILFGHKRGAFTGATADQEGLIKEANQGTLFLDEIGELSLDLQVKLLRVLQEKAFRPLGAKQDDTSNFRLIAATHRNLLDKVEDGSFREDLFYRIAVGVLQLPALIERGDDLQLLAEHLLAEVNSELSDQPSYISKKFCNKVSKVIKTHPWLGNVRELRTTILRVCAWTDKKIISAEDFAAALIERHKKPSEISLQDITQGIDLEEEINKLQLAYIAKAEEITAGQITKMARLLGFKNHQTLSKRIEVLRKNN